MDAQRDSTSRLGPPQRQRVESPESVVTPCFESDMSASVASNLSIASNLSTTAATAAVDGAGGDGSESAPKRQMPQQADAQQLPQGASITAPVCSTVAAALNHHVTISYGPVPPPIDRAQPPKASLAH